MRFTSAEIQVATGAVATGDLPSGIAMRISTDTRAIEPGDAFLALTGESFDGHEFVGDAFARGAALAIVQRADAIPPGKPALVVEATVRAYMNLAGAARTRSRACIIAITGSTGKTTTKTLLAQLLAHGGMRVAATPQNENNEIGVSKLFLGLEGDEEAVVVEMGCRHYGEIEELVAFARPDVGILTNVGEAHLEIMGSLERIAETKWGLFAQGASAVLNIADGESRARSTALSGRSITWFGVGDATAEPPGPATLIPRRDVLEFFDGEKRDTIQVQMNLPGDHNLANLAAAVAAARDAGVSATALVAAIPSLVLPPGRYQRIALAQEVVAVFDAYNASLSGTIATLRAFATEPGTRRIAMLGGMAEMGPDTARMHEQIGAEAHEQGIDIVLAGGSEAAATARGARGAGMRVDAVIEYAENGAAIDWLRANLHSGDVLLLKGSRMYKMEDILSALRAGVPLLH